MTTGSGDPGTAARADAGRLRGAARVEFTRSSRTAVHAALTPILGQMSRITQLGQSGFLAVHT
jgi:hypothetical protein